MTAELKGLRDASGALRYTVLGVAIAGGLLLAGIPSKAAEKERQPGDDGAVTVEIKDSTGATLNRNQLQGTVIGRQVSLTASILPAGVQVTSHQWTIPGNRIKSYTQTRESAEKADILPADLQQQTVSCYWLEGASAHIVGYAAQVQGPTGPQTARATVKFSVAIPTGVSLVPTMRANCIGVGDNGFPPADDQTIHFGTRAAPAMRFGATVTSPAGFSGQIGLLQLIKTDCIARTLPDHVVSHRTSGQDFVLDNHGTQVFGALIAVPAGQSVTLHATGTEAPLNPWNDTPWCTLLVENPPRVDGTTINEDRMRDYLMYRPEGADSIWVTLRKGGTWGWSAFAELNAQHVWVLREHAQTAPGITTPSNELPLWSSYFGALEFH